LRFAALVIVFAFIALPATARAQAINPTGIAINMMRLVYGAMYPAPQCGPHDAPAPQPYQPPPPTYIPPPPHPGEASDFDSGDDDDYQPVQPRSSRHLRADGEQSGARTGAGDDSDQTAGVRERDSHQPDYEPVTSDEDDGQPLQAAAKRHRSAQPAAQTIEEPGQVAEIPSLPRTARPSADNQIYDPQP
jgi:hypothetical protein